MTRHVLRLQSEDNQKLDVCPRGLWSRFAFRQSLQSSGILFAVELDTLLLALTDQLFPL